MRYFGNLHTPPSPVWPDTIVSKKLTAGSVEAFDLPAGVTLMRASFGSTDLGGVAHINMGSTKASAPTTAYGQSTQGSSEFNVPIGMGDARMYQLTTAMATGFSVVSPSSGYICIEYWKRGGTTTT